MAEKRLDGRDRIYRTEEMSDGRDENLKKIKFLLRKEFYRKYIVLGDEINNK